MATNKETKSPALNLLLILLLLSGLSGCEFINEKLVSRLPQTTGSVNSKPGDTIALNNQDVKTAGFQSLSPVILDGLKSKARPINGDDSPIVGLFPLVDAGVGDAILSVGASGKVILWTLDDGHGFLLAEIGPTTLTDFSVRGLGFAFANDSTVKALSLNNPDHVYVLDRVKTKITGLSMSPDGESAYFGGADAKLYHWRFVEEEKLRSYKEKQEMLSRYLGHATVVSAVAVHPFGRVFFSADWYGRLMAWLRYDADPYKGEYDEGFFGPRFFGSKSDRQGTDRAEKDPIEHLVVSNDGNYLVLGDQSGKVEVWQVRGFKKICELQMHKGAIGALAISQDASAIVTSARDGKLKWSMLIVNKDNAINDNRCQIQGTKELNMSNITAVVVMKSGHVFAGTREGKVLEPAFG